VRREKSPCLWGESKESVDHRHGGEWWAVIQEVHTFVSDCYGERMDEEL